jgi:putative YhdH/YhfP family quinone oxidoreductase
MAVNLLAGLGYEVVASTGKAESHEFLRQLGAVDIVERSSLGETVGRPLDSMLWAGAVDCVGGVTLANVLSKIRYGGAVAASGLTGGAQIPTTVMPFILRGVSLLGIDSVQTPMERRRQVWERLGGELKPNGIEEIGRTIELEELDGVLSSILQGGLTGRYVVRSGG